MSPFGKEERVRHRPPAGLYRRSVVSRNAAQIATLQRQVEHFAGQVTRLTADYRKLAETLRGPGR